MTGSLLRSGKLNDYRVLGDAGQSVYSVAGQIRQAVVLVGLKIFT